MSGPLRAITALAVAVYALAAAAHAGLVPITGPIPAAAIVEALLGLVTLAGLAIVLARGLIGVHFVMLGLLAIGFARTLRTRGAASST